MKRVPARLHMSTDTFVWLQLGDELSALSAEMKLLASNGAEVTRLRILPVNQLAQCPCVRLLARVPRPH